MEGSLEPSKPLFFEKVNLESVVLSKFWIPIVVAAAVALTHWECCRLFMWDTELVSVNLHSFPRNFSEVSVASEVSHQKHVTEQEGFGGQQEGSGAQFWEESTAMDTRLLSCREGSDVHIV